MPYNINQVDPQTVLCCAIATCVIELLCDQDWDKIELLRTTHIEHWSSVVIDIITRSSGEALQYLPQFGITSNKDLKTIAAHLSEESPDLLLSYFPYFSSLSEKEKVDLVSSCAATGVHTVASRP